MLLSADTSNVFDKKQQGIALRRLGWSLRRIEAATRFAITALETAPSTSTAASRSRPPSMARRAGSGSASRCSGTICTSACWRQRRANSCGSISGRRRGGYRIHDDDRSARTPPSMLAQLARATTAGPHIGTVCTHIHQHDGVPAVPSRPGHPGAAKKHGVAVNCFNQGASLCSHTHAKRSRLRQATNAADLPEIPRVHALTSQVTRSAQECGAR